MEKHVELLAPAGGLEQLKAAVYNGADAVYFGGEKFSARAKAANFTREDLIKARRITARYGVRLYCAINTMLFDEELEEALGYVAELEALGVDALIIQDLGLLSLIRKRFPDMELHSSTQMSIQNHYGLDHLKQLGVKRAVLPRETSLRDLERLKDRGIELEAFVHGAICICFSGQCLMSSMIGGRSGNRGACAQPCRLKYALVDLETGKTLTEDSSALLSPKDMMLINSMDQLIDAGITSFKIEGRMKTPEYVATIVRHYRKAIDQALEGKPRELEAEEEKEIAQVFSRDFTDAYLKGESGKDLMNPKKPNNRGVLLGRVQSSRAGKAEVLLKSPLELGDKISIWTTKEGRINLSVDRILKDGASVGQASPGEQVTLDIGARVGLGDRVFRMESAALKRQVREQIEAHEADEKIRLDVLVRGRVGEPLELRFTDEDGGSVTVRGEQLLEEARKHPLDEEGFRSQMRLGDTDYLLGQVQMEAGPVMVPKSVLNSLRREAVEALEEERQKRLEPRPLDWEEEPAARAGDAPLRVSVLVETVEKARIALDLGADDVILPLLNFRAAGSRDEEVERFLDEVEEAVRSRIVFELPRILREEDLPIVETLLEKWIPRVGGFKAHTLDQAVLLRRLGAKTIHGDASLNAANPESVRFFREEMGVDVLELSRELNLSQLAFLPREGQLPLYGVQELMVMEHCILGSELGKGACRRSRYALRDRKDVDFPVLADGLGKNHIFNGRVLMLTEDVGTLLAMGFRNFSLSFVLRPPEEMRRVLRAYLGMLRGTLTLEEGCRILLEGATGYTKGHYHRGVL